jgi:hypothetical protein
VSELVPQKGEEEEEKTSGVKIQCVLERISGGLAKVHYWSILAPIEVEQEPGAPRLDSIGLNVTGDLEYDPGAHRIRSNRMYLVFTMRGEVQTADVAALGRVDLLFKPE